MIARGEPNRLLGSAPPILIDEWQRLPAMWDLVRRAVDGGAAAGQFLLTGSASPAGLGTHSGAGRIVSLRMRPLALSERPGASPTVSLANLLTGHRSAHFGATPVGIEYYTHEILASGFPGFRSLEGRILRAQIERRDGRVVALEVKLARTVEERDVKHLLWLRDTIGDNLLDAAVITTGPDAYRRQDGIGVIPAALLGP